MKSPPLPKKSQFRPQQKINEGVVCKYLGLYIGLYIQAGEQVPFSTDPLPLTDPTALLSDYDLVQSAVETLTFAPSLQKLVVILDL